MTTAPPSELDLIIAHACPQLPDGPPVSLLKGQADSAYISHYGALPPTWSDARRLKFELDREDSVLICCRQGSTETAISNASRWLARHGLDRKGRPLAQSTTDAANVPPYALAR